MYLTCITVTQSTIITSPIRLNIGLTNVNARLKQRCIKVVPTLCNVVSTLFQRRALTLYQRCVTLKIRRRLLFHFQRRINVISTLIHNVETMLIRRRNIGWETLYQTFNRFEISPSQRSHQALYPLCFICTEQDNNVRTALCGELL